MWNGIGPQHAAMSAAAAAERASNGTLRCARHENETQAQIPDRHLADEAIKSFLQQLDKQEKKGFKDLASLLSLLPKPAKSGSVGSMSVANHRRQCDRGWVSPGKGPWNYHWNMPKRRFHKMNPQAIPCYPWLCTSIMGYPGISLSDVPSRRKAPKESLVDAWSR
jgi:hypothetical protein